jgi:hypothetical protein
MSTGSQPGGLVPLNDAGGRWILLEILDQVVLDVKAIPRYFPISNNNDTTLHATSTLNQEKYPSRPDAYFPKIELHRLNKCHIKIATSLLEPLQHYINMTSFNFFTLLANHIIIQSNMYFKADRSYVSSELLICST